MKIGLLTCRWRRPEVFEKFALGIRRLQDKFDVIPLVVGSEGDKSHCEGFHYLERPNNPLGRKWNEGMKAMRSLKPDYVMIMGSDDFMTDDTMQYIIDRCKEGYDLIGIKDCYFYDARTERLGYWKGFRAPHRVNESMGMCRTINGRMLEKMKWQPWHSTANKGLDWTMTLKIRGIRHKSHVFSMREKELFAMDYKTKDNICNFDMYDTEIVDNVLIKQIPEL